MGLGKTVQVIAAAQQLLKFNLKTLVICPASAVENWKREYEKWWRGGRQYHPTVISYASLIRRWRQMQGGGWDLVILDEAHYCKTPSAKRTMRALKIAADADRAWLLSGTPMPNHPGELWPIMRKLWPEIPAAFGCKNAFQWFNTFTLWTPTVFGPRPYGTRKEKTKLLRRHFAKVMLRRRVSQVGLDLPPLRVNVHHLPRDDEMKRALADFGDARDLEALMQQENEEGGSVSRLRRLLGEYKTPRIAELIVEELQAGAYPSIVVLAHHRNSLARLASHFKAKGISYVGFHGGTPPAKRQEAIDVFQAGTVAVFLAQQTAAGIAINLWRASEIVLVEPSWSPEDNAQAIKRIHRIGQDHPCRARLFAVSGTLDEALMGVLAQKAQMITDVLGGEE